MSQDLSQIRHVQRGDPVSQEHTGQPTRAIELRLQRLENLLRSSASSSETNRQVLHDVALNSLVGERDIVFFNAATGEFEQAIATVTFSASTYNFNPTALAVGVVLSVNGTRGDVMIGGYDTWVDDDHKADMLESTEVYQPGLPYYLSAREAGKITRVPPPLKIQVLIGTDNHYIISPTYCNPDATEALFKSSIGMRPVGSLRTFGPGFTHNVVVGFDALEYHLPAESTWRSTRDSSVDALRNFGYLIADAEVTVQPAAPIFVSLEVATNGTITVYSASTLAELYASGPNRFNETTSLTALNSNKDTVRVYSVQDAVGTALGSLKFKFVDNDRTFVRRVVFKFPDSFQGWKMINTPITPLATAVVTNGVVTRVDVVEGSIGFDTAPTVVFTGVGTGAAATAVLNELGSIVGFTVTNGGTGYTSAPAVTFDGRLTSASVLNGGSGATATVALSSGAIASATVTAGGTGYKTPPNIEILSTAGSGAKFKTAINPDGSLASITVLDGGSGYVSPTVSVIPPGNSDYRKTKAGTFTAAVSGGAITGITVVDGGLGYPVGATARAVGLGTGATLTVVLDGSGTVTAITVGAGGTGFSVAPTIEVDQWDPVAVHTTAGGATTQATVALTAPAMDLDRVDITCTGMNYHADTTLTLSGGLGSGGVAATIKPVLDANGRIVQVRVLTRGSNYISVPSVVISNDTSALGHQATFAPRIRTEITSVAVSTPGAGYTSPPTLAAGVPVESIRVVRGGSGYSVAPAVTVEAPGNSGVTATATAILGGSVALVTITNPGSGYTNPSAITIVPTGGLGGGGVAAQLKPLFLAGQLVAVQIVDGGSGYTSAPALALSGSPGSGATLTAAIDSVGSVIKINMTRHGTRYTEVPDITIAAPVSGTTAEASAYMAGGGASFTANISGHGGQRVTQTSLPLDRSNNLQIYSFRNDLDDSSTQAFKRPVDAAFYYNIKADPGLKARYPAVPIEKCSLILNGNELNMGVYNESLGTSKDPDADAVLCRKTIFWPSNDQLGSPWDQSWQPYVLDLGTGGRDHIIPTSGLAGYEDHFWRFWEHVFKYEPQKNKGWVHLNKTSRFYQSGRVVSLGALAPLRLIDSATGVDTDGRGTPMTGQLMLVLDNQVNILDGTKEQLNLVNAGEVKPVYVNNTNKQVFVSSILLQCVFQSTQDGAITAVTNCAKVTAGTQSGDYRNMIGTIDPTADLQQGVETKIYKQGQVKELFPDARDASFLLEPNQKLFVRVDAPAGSPITSQLVVVKVKAHVF